MATVHREGRAHAVSETEEAENNQLTWELARIGIVGVPLLLVLLWLGKGQARRNAPLALLCVLSMAADNFLVTLPLHMNSALWFANRHDWNGIIYANWEGKAYSTLVALLLMLALRGWISRERFGLTFRLQPGSIQPSVILGIVLLVPALLSFFASKGPLDCELLIYLLLMPALNEELVYRGLMLGLANILTPPRWALGGARVGWGLIVVTVTFGLLHGLSVEPEWHVSLNLGPVVISSCYGLAFGWMRERTGSLLVPAVSHGLSDFLGFFGRMV